VELLLTGLKGEICVGDGVCVSWWGVQIGFQGWGFQVGVVKLGWSRWGGQVRVFKSRCAGRGFVNFLVSIL
jgi:hypothetical protein